VVDSIFEQPLPTCSKSDGQSFFNFFQGRCPARLPFLGRTAFGRQTFEGFSCARFLVNFKLVNDAQRSFKAPASRGEPTRGLGFMAPKVTGGAEGRFSEGVIRIVGMGSAIPTDGIFDSAVTKRPPTGLRGILAKRGKSSKGSL